MAGTRDIDAGSFALGQRFAWAGMQLALLTLGAHFYRAGEYGIAISVAGIIVFACLRSAWKQYAVAFFLLWGMLEWGGSACTLASMRMQMGMPWMRGAAILGVVAFLTGLAGTYALSRAKGKDEAGSPALLQALVFIITFLSLFYLRQAASMYFLLLERYVPLIGSVQIFFASWYAAFVAGKLSDARHARKTRKAVWLAFCCIFFAQFFLGVLGFDRMLMTGTLHVPIPAFIIFAPVFRDSLSMMPLIVLVATLLVGSAWCSMLCYFGPVDSLVAGNKGVRDLPAGVRLAQKYGRVVILLTGIGAALALRAWGLSTANAISIAVAYGAASLMFMAFISRKYNAMLHCTTACPMGLVVNLLGRVSPWRVKARPSHCDNCGACEKVCKYSAITPESRAAGKTLLRCTLCRDCIGACKKSALYLHCPGLAPETARNVFTGLIAVVHVIFLSVAMV